MLDALVRVLNETTVSGTNFFGWPGVATGLLSGQALLEFSDRYIKQVVTARYGLYFLFFRSASESALVPLYVGIGNIPARVLQHFRPTQYIDQVLSLYQGGMTQYPQQHLSSEQLAKLGENLRVFHVGFLFLARSHREANDAMKLEQRFQEALQPVGNKGYYSVASSFELREVAASWKGVDETKQFPDLQELKARHNVLVVPVATP